jgi:hypothetical protein
MFKLSNTLSVLATSGMELVMGFGQLYFAIMYVVQALKPFGEALYNFVHWLLDILIPTPPPHPGRTTHGHAIPVQTGQGIAAMALPSGGITYAVNIDRIEVSGGDHDAAARAIRWQLESLFADMTTGGTQEMFRREGRELA